MRNFPFELFLFGLGLLGILSWTKEVELFRLGIPSVYEHMIAYAALTVALIAAKGLRPVSLSEMHLIVLLASSAEFLKYRIPFRHPKISDFYADILGALLVATGFFVLTIIMRLIWRMIRFSIFRSNRKTQLRP